MLETMSARDAGMYFSGGLTITRKDQIPVYIREVSRGYPAKSNALMARCYQPEEPGGKDWTKETTIRLSDLVLEYPSSLGYVNAYVRDNVFYFQRSVQRTVRKLLSGNSYRRSEVFSAGTLGQNLIQSRRNGALRPYVLHHFFEPSFRPIKIVAREMVSGELFCEAVSRQHCLKYTPTLDVILLLSNETPVGFLERDNRIVLFPRTRDYAQEVEKLCKGDLNVSI